MNKLLFVLFVSVFVLTTQKVEAFSAVAKGVKSVHVNNQASDMAKAMENALEACSQYDSNCRLIKQCDKGGFSAVAAEKVNGVITSLGAVCSLNSAEDAKKEALRICSIDSKKDNCIIRAFWEE